MKKAGSSGFVPVVMPRGLVGCATIPAGPSVMVLPGTGKSFEPFQVENARGAVGCVDRGAAGGACQGGVRLQRHLAVDGFQWSA